MIKPKSCPVCGSENIEIWHTVSSKLPFWYDVECADCYCCGKRKLFLRRAIKSWNKREGIWDKNESDNRR